MKNRIYALIFILICSLSTIFVTNIYSIEKNKDVIDLQYGNFGNSNLIQTKEIITKELGFDEYRTYKLLPNGDRYFTTKLVFAEETEVLNRKILLDLSPNAKIFYYDYENEEMISYKLFDHIDEELPLENIYIQSDKGSYYFSTVGNYTNFKQYASIEFNPNNTLPMTFEQIDGQTYLNINFKGVLNTEGHFYILKSNEQLLDIDKEENQSYYALHNKTFYHIFTYDGYYYESPSTYYPYSETMYWRNPGIYTAAAYIKNTDTNNRYAQSLAYAMLDTIINYAEKEGYYLSYPLSFDFLYENYGIEDKFYDTRFNSDITLAMIEAYKRTKDERFLDFAKAHMEFFMDFAMNNNYNVSRGGKLAILVEDYYKKDAVYNKTHSSLNHQLAEILVLYEMYDVTGNEEYFEFSHILMQGIRHTIDFWIKDDLSLEYAYTDNGPFGVDYPYLTYNDLLKLKRKRQELNLSEDPYIEKLLKSKKIQMYRKGIAGYLQ